MSNLKEIRERANLSQSKLAEISGVSVRMIQKYEQGDRDINKASGDTLYRLAITLESPIENIIETALILAEDERDRIAEYLNKNKPKED